MPVHAEKVTEPTKQKQAAEAERAQIKQKLGVLQREISRTETDRGRAADALGQSERAISEANRALYELTNNQKEAEAKLAELTEEQNRLTKAVATQKSQLGKLLREQYAAGNEDRIKLLLSGDNPNRINRDLQYMGYVSQAQAKLIGELNANLQAIEQNQATAQIAKDELEKIAQEQRDQKTALEKEKTHRATLLAQLSSRLSAQRKEAGNIQRDEQKLAGLVDKLGKLIEEQRKAEAAAQEKRRLEQIAQAQARAKNKGAAKKNTSKGKIKSPTSSPDAIDNDEAPATEVARNELTSSADVQGGGFGRAFTSLRGQIRLPVKGDLVSKYGSKRPDGPSSKGVFIRTADGAEVKAVAAGKVVFAEWLRGFGNLVIIDHGDQYMTIYGNNQAVLKRPGDVVKTGDIIANAGNSGGNEQSGLYFEMRHQGRAFDPMEWVTR